MFVKTIIERSKILEIMSEIEPSAFFSVKFIKRSNGELREMNCRRCVEKYLKGGTLAYNPSEKGLIPVWDVQAGKSGNGYRMIPIEGIIEIKGNGKTWNFEV